LGIILIDPAKTPINQDANFSGGVYFDTGLTTGNYSAYLSDTDYITGTGGALLQTAPNFSCNRLKETGTANGSGTQFINPTGVASADFEVYCDMSIA